MCDSTKSSFLKWKVDEDVRKRKKLIWLQKYVPDSREQLFKYHIKMSTAWKEVWPCYFPEDYVNRSTIEHPQTQVNMAVTKMARYLDMIFRCPPCILHSATQECCWQLRLDVPSILFLTWLCMQCKNVRCWAPCLWVAEVTQWHFDSFYVLRTDQRKHHTWTWHERYQGPKFLQIHLHLHIASLMLLLEVYSYLWMQLPVAMEETT